MKILSSSLAHFTCSKIPTKVFDIFTKDTPTEIVVGYSNFELKKDLNILTSIKVTFKTADKKEDIGYVHIFVSVNLELTDEEIKNNTETTSLIQFYVSREAWPLYNLLLPTLKNFKIEYDELPPPPPKASEVKE